MLLDYFFTFVQIVNIVIFHSQYINRGYLVSTAPHTIFLPIFLKLCTLFSIVWKYACAFDIIFALILATLSTLRTLSFSDLRCIDSGYLVIANPHTILYRSILNFAHIFPRVCISACCLDIIFKFIFVTFSTLTLSFSYLRFYESVYIVGTFWAQLLTHHMRICMCSRWNAYINFFYLK